MKSRGISTGAVALIIILIIAGIGYLWIKNPEGVFNKAKNQSKLTLTLTDPPDEWEWENEWHPKLKRDEPMRIMGYALSHIYMATSIEIHNSKCNWFTLLENEEIDLVELAKREENRLYNIPADNYDNAKITVYRICIVVETPHGSIRQCIIFKPPLVTTIPLRQMVLKAGGHHQLRIDFRGSAYFSHITVIEGEVRFEVESELPVCCAHKEKGEAEWKIIVEE